MKGTELVADASARLVALAEVAEQAHDYAHQAKAPSTWRAYRSDWRHFSAWCQTRGFTALPAEPSTIVLYVSALAPERKVATPRRRLSAVSQAHKTAGRESPTRHATVALTWQGIRRTHGTAQEGKAPAVTSDVRAMVDVLPGSTLGARDRALLLGFAGAFRRSEPVGLDVADVAFTSDGLVVTLRRSKTDQEGEGCKVGIRYGSRSDACPVRGLHAWLEVSGISAGPIFRPITRHGRILEQRLSDRAVALVVKRAARAAGLDSSRYAGHSLRAGLATSAAAGVSERVIAEQTGHKNTTVLGRYIREGNLSRENAAACVGL